MMKHLQRLILLYCLTWCLCVCTLSLVLPHYLLSDIFLSLSKSSLNCVDDLENEKKEDKINLRLDLFIL